MRASGAGDLLAGLPGGPISEDRSTGSAVRWRAEAFHYPHPRHMAGVLDSPRCRWAWGLINAVNQARSTLPLTTRWPTPAGRVWCFAGDGETDEPESMGAISLAGRERLDNLIFVVNCNLQRLDGPVRGNGKIIQELEALFRGAGWHVIKVVWGREWDELLARDVDGVLLNQMNTTVDGQFQKFAVESGAYIRERFFGPDPRLAKMVEHLSDDDLRHLRRVGHDYRKVYAGVQGGRGAPGSPTVILAQTIKGWALGPPDFRGPNATHQLKRCRRRSSRPSATALPRHPRLGARGRPLPSLPPLPGPDSPEVQYLQERRAPSTGTCRTAW